MIAPSAIIWETERKKFFRTNVCELKKEFYFYIASD
jgi:hypothetical protein